MLSAALKGKIPITEDVLTAALFDALAASSDSVVLRLLLGQAETLSRGSLELPAWQALTVDLWKQTPAGEPDVVVELIQGGHPVARVVVEVKFGAGKSGNGEIEEAEPGRGDQLARYAVDVAKAGSVPVYVVYLTEHACLPDAELQVSLREIARSPKAGQIKGIAWLSWRDVERILSCQPPGSPLGRVAQVLELVDMYRFDGAWTKAPCAFKDSPVFYKAKTSYRLPPTCELPSSWRYGLQTFSWTAAPLPVRPFPYRGRL